MIVQWVPDSAARWVAGVAGLAAFVSGIVGLTIWADRSESDVSLLFLSLWSFSCGLTISIVNGWEAWRRTW